MKLITEQVFFAKHMLFRNKRACLDLLWSHVLLAMLLSLAICLWKCKGPNLFY